MGVAGPGGGCYHDILGYKSGQGVTLGHTLGKVTRHVTE